MRINISSHDLSYEIVHERGALNKLKKYLKLDRKVLIVTDSGVQKEYAEKVSAQCAEAFVITIPEGEQSKNVDNYLLILRELLKNNFTRRDCVIAVGGGVCGDMAAFAASTYMRGICFYNIPTTVLSMVDSSIGGKTAIDFEGVKNVVGSFFQPSAVIIDADVLKSLDPRQVSAGLSEAIKMAATSDEKLFEFIENSRDLNADIAEIIERANAVKKAVVEEDPEEKGLRKVLNFGHTVGHAVESAAKGRLLHGECVAIGMMFMCSDEAKGRLEAVLNKYSLPTRSEFSPKELVELMKHDKKAGADGVSTVYVNKIGSFEFRKMNWDELSKIG